MLAHLRNILVISEETLPGAPLELPPHWVVVPQQSLTLVDHKLLISCTCWLEERYNVKVLVVLQNAYIKIDIESELCWKMHQNL